MPWRRRRTSLCLGPPGVEEVVVVGTKAEAIAECAPRARSRTGWVNTLNGGRSRSSPRTTSPTRQTFVARRLRSRASSAIIRGLEDRVLPGVLLQRRADPEPDSRPAVRPARPVPVGGRERHRRAQRPSRPSCPATRRGRLDRHRHARLPGGLRGQGACRRCKLNPEREEQVHPLRQRLVGRGASTDSATRASWAVTSRRLSRAGVRRASARSGTSGRA